MKKELIRARHTTAINLLNDLDDIRQFYFGNLKALVEKSDSVDKLLFDRNRERLKGLTLKVTEMITGMEHADPMNAVFYLEGVPAIPDSPQSFDGLTVRQLRALLAVWPDVDENGNELKVRIDGPENTALLTEQVRVLNDADLWLHRK